MEQTSLHRYFQTTYKPKPSKSRLSFLDFPYAVRYRVYELAGLVRDCPIDLNSLATIKDEDYLGCFGRPSFSSDNDIGAFKCFYRNQELRERYPGAFPEVYDVYERLPRPNLSIIPSWDTYWWSCDCKPLPSRLLLVSKVIHEEVCKILYSDNTFVVCRSRFGGLSPLRRLGPRALASLTSLRVQLNACACCEGATCSTKGHSDLNGPHQMCDQGHDELLLMRSRYGKSAISDWRDTCKAITKHLQPPRLKLCFICDAANHRTARAVLVPLLRFSTLQECSIRLGQESDHELRRLAQFGTLKTTGHLRYYRGPFMFSSLPEEIRCQILSFTDLVAPTAIQWDPSLGVLHWCQYKRNFLSGSCCPILHAASSSHCNCWRFPLHIFQVNRKMHADATRVFYASNTFTLDVHPGKPPRPDSAIAVFLKRLPRASWPHIHNIDLVFRRLSDIEEDPYEFDPHKLEPKSPEAFGRDWLRTIYVISENLNLSALRLHLDLSKEFGVYRHGGSSTDEQYVANLEERKWDVYKRFMKPASRLRGLKDLFIHISWPSIGDSRDKRRNHEEILEKSIMGQHYDSSRRGKRQC
ncbi:MAG: hypothetical protein M1836_001321 [Candelina mexicana]|nr:MAG: hypothetical protein M1836_001321 [Candelina mexicana]